MIEWDYNGIVKLKSCVAERCGLPSKCGRYRISIFEPTLAGMHTNFVAEVLAKNGWDMISNHKRLEQAKQACENHANGVEEAKDVPVRPSNKNPVHKRRSR